MPQHAIKAISTAFSKLSVVGSLKAEIALLTSCSSDTVYRLRYDTMQYDYISPAVINLLGYTPQELMQMNLRSLILETRIVTEGMKLVESYAELEESRKRGQVEQWQADYLMKTKDGRKIWVSDVSRPWFDKKGAIIGSSGSLRDITERINAELKIRNELTKTDYTDPLTGLGNLRKFWLRIEEELRRSRRTQDPVCVMLVSINKLEEIRNAYDKKMAETIIVTAARLIRPILREIDIVAHIEEGRFGIVMPETDAEGATYAARRLIKILSEHSFFAHAPEAQNTPVTLSIGIADAKHGSETDAKALYTHADTQLYAAMRNGENQVVTTTREEQ